MSTQHKKPMEAKDYERLARVAKADKYGFIIREAIRNAALRNDRQGMGLIASAADVSTTLKDPETGYLVTPNQHSYSAQFSYMRQLGEIEVLKDHNGKAVTRKSVANDNGHLDVLVYKFKKRPISRAVRQALLDRSQQRKYRPPLSNKKD